jgi:cytolysin (calcineurin-like family phosphatase)
VVENFDGTPGRFQEQLDDLAGRIAANAADIDALEKRADESDLRQDESEAQAALDRDILATLQIDEELTRQHVRQLEQALRTSRVIGAAIGMVMNSRRVTQDEALEVLKEASSRSNVKLRTLCAEMLRKGSSTI